MLYVQGHREVFDFRCRLCYIRAIDHTGFRRQHLVKRLFQTCRTRTAESATINWDPAGVKGRILPAHDSEGTAVGSSCFQKTRLCFPRERAGYKSWSEEKGTPGHSLYYLLPSPSKSCLLLPGHLSAPQSHGQATMRSVHPSLTASKRAHSSSALATYHDCSQHELKSQR
jgi:hypothetical protein